MYWTEDELRVAVGLSYCRPWRELTDSHDLCVEISSILSRTPTSLERQIRNIQKLHRVPTHYWDEVAEGGRKFSDGIGKSCKEVVRLYRRDPVKLIREVHGMSSQTLEPVKDYLPRPKELFNTAAGEVTGNAVVTPFLGTHGTRELVREFG